MRSFVFSGVKKIIAIPMPKLASNEQVQHNGAAHYQTENGDYIAADSPILRVWADSLRVTTERDGKTSTAQRTSGNRDFTLAERLLPGFGFDPSTATVTLPNIDRQGRTAKVPEGATTDMSAALAVLGLVENEAENEAENADSGGETPNA